MVRTPCFALLAAALLALTACARKPMEVQAADAAQKLLAAAWAGDAKSFEADIDRPAIRADLRKQLAEVAQANTLSVEGGASDAALDRMISLGAFRLTDAEGAPLTAAPTTPQVLALIAPVGEDRACIRAAADDPTCRLTFGRAGESWKLVAMSPAGFTIAIPPPPSKDD